MTRLTAAARACENPDSCPLNVGSHARERCAVDALTLEVVGAAVGHQVLVRRSARRLALYTVAELVAAEAAVRAGTGGLGRLVRDGDPTLPASFDVTVDAQIIGGDERASLTEELLGEDGAAGLAILAPHGGMIEPGTDLQAEAVHRALVARGKPVRAWIVRGINRATGAHTCWHVTSSEISEHSFPQLAALVAARRPFAHAVAFHGQSSQDCVAVGGGLPDDPGQTRLKRRLAARIRRALADDPGAPEVEVVREGPLAGAQPSNVVNRVTERGNGIQIEQPLRVRDQPGPRDAIAAAVAEFYADLV